MNRRLLIVLAGVAVLACAAFGAFTLTRSKVEPAPAAPVAAARPAAAPAAPAPAPAPAPEPAPPPVPAPRRPAASAVAEPVAPAAAIAAVTLQIDVDVPGAQVFLDRRFIGEAPVTTTEVDPGSHKIDVSAKGYDSVSQTITVTPGSQSVSVKVREVRLNARLEVVHKHRMGSCTGVLTATPRGLRYETTDKDDAFSAELLDLETFEVDYLQKNLRIKSKRGKRLDFTDPAGNADRLFVFHRDVDKARERLKKGDPPSAE
jgi:hypothetical protein